MSSDSLEIRDRILVEHQRRCVTVPLDAVSQAGSDFLEDALRDWRGEWRKTGGKDDTSTGQIIELLKGLSVEAYAFKLEESPGDRARADANILYGKFEPKEHWAVGDEIRVNSIAWWNFTFRGFGSRAVESSGSSKIVSCSHLRVKFDNPPGWTFDWFEEEENLQPSHFSFWAGLVAGTTKQLTKARNFWRR